MDSFLKVSAAAALVLMLTSPTVAKVSADEQAYREAIAARAAKIVEKLDLADAQQAVRVSTLVAGQYRVLRDIHDARDLELARLENSSENEQQESERSRIEAEADLDVQAAHRKFIARLGAELVAADVDRIKDGMTYGVVPATYGVYLQLLPGLTDEERREIMANLLEAREYAMDAGSSDEKHGWFGKYKGRINNYLSARGYDLKQAEKDLAARRHKEQDANETGKSQ